MVFDLTAFDLGYIAGATVSVVGGPSTMTDVNGAFGLTGVTPGTHLLLQVTKSTDFNRFFSHDAYATVSYSTAELVVDVEAGETTHVYPRLIEGCVAFLPNTPGVATFNVSGGICDDVPRPAMLTTVTFDPTLVSYADGSAFSGTVQLELIPTAAAASAADVGDPPAGSWFIGTPGDRSAVRLDGSVAELQTLGAAEIRLFDSSTGAPLILLPGNNAVVQFDTTRYAANGEAVGTFSFDVDAGVWDELDAGVVFADAGTPVATITLSQLGTPLQIASPLGATACVQGHVTIGGSTAPGITLVAFGEDHAASYTGRSDDSGNFCLDVRANSTLALDSVGWSGSLPYRAVGQVSSGAGGTCAVGTGCVNVGTIDLQLEDTICATGQIFDQNFVFPDDGGSPVNPPDSDPASIYIDVPVDADESTIGRYPRAYRGLLVPNPDATFCLPVPGDSIYQYTIGNDPGCSIILPINNSTVGGSCSADASACQTLGELDYYCGS